MALVSLLKRVTKWLLFVKTKFNIGFSSRLRTSILKIVPDPIMVGLIIDIHASSRIRKFAILKYTDTSSLTFALQYLIFCSTFVFRRSYTFDI